MYVTICYNSVRLCNSVLPTCVILCAHNVLTTHCPSMPPVHKTVEVSCFTHSCSRKLKSPNGHITQHIRVMMAYFLIHISPYFY